ncbi:hypothetical protein ACFCWG_48095 [Streptomyces sp. NPDC056390]|uniref:hypothetical protein n=1 Tax=Streptomyces sp. NPDC056390 TaxID=3345806 RepID=UPI0035DBA7DA
MLDGADDWGVVLDEFESADAVVLLTTHRSKGLEYHPVFFLGIHGRQWWVLGSGPRAGREGQGRRGAVTEWAQHGS